MVTGYKRKSSAFITISRPHLLPSSKRRLAHRSVEVRRYDSSRLSTTTDRILGEIRTPQCPSNTDLDNSGTAGNLQEDDLTANFTQEVLGQESIETPDPLNGSDPPAIMRMHNLVCPPSFSPVATVDSGTVNSTLSMATAPPNISG